MSNRQGAGEHIRMTMHIMYPDIYPSGCGCYSLTFGVAIDDGIMSSSNVDVYVDITDKDGIWPQVHDIYCELSTRGYPDALEMSGWLSDEFEAVPGLYDFWTESITVEEV